MKRGKPIVIGVVGFAGSGKTTFCHIFLEILKKNDIVGQRIGLGDIIGVVLSGFGIEKSRENLQRLGALLCDMKPDAITQKIRSTINNKSCAKVFVLDAIRTSADLKFLRSFHENLLVCVFSDTETRYDHMRTRGQKSGEREKSNADFKREDCSDIENTIDSISESADYTIHNSNDLPKFRKAILDFFNQKIRSAIQEGQPIK